MPSLSARQTPQDFDLGCDWKLTRFLEYPDLELSNNLAENSMRPVALGRKKLDTHRQRTGGTQGCGDSVGRGKLPQVETPSARLFGRGSARVFRSPDPEAPGLYSRCVVAQHS